MKKYVRVLQKHIDDAKKIIHWVKDEPLYCPIALALHDSLNDGYKIKSHSLSRSVKWAEPIKNNVSISVAKSIYLSGIGIEGCWPPCEIKILDKTIINFINQFDKNLPVQPFAFVINLNFKNRYIISK